MRVDDVRLPSGETATRDVIEHPGAVAMIALTENDELIMVRQWRYPVEREMLELPAGLIDDGEDDVDCASRELDEETGYRPARVTPLFSFYPSAGYSDERVGLFLREGCALIPHEDDIDEPTDVVLIPRSDLPSLLENGPDQVQDAISLVGLLHREPGS